MTLRVLSLLMLPVLISGCAGSPRAGDAWITPSEAARLSAGHPPEGIEGVFAMRVEGVLAMGLDVQLHSSADVTDERALVVEMAVDVANAVAARAGAGSYQALADREILVRGTARRARNYLFPGDGGAGRDNMTTYIRVSDAAQVELR